MPRKAKQVVQEESHSEELEVIHEEKPKRPKRKCTEKQLAALAAGRAKNPRFKPKAKLVELRILDSNQKLSQLKLLLLIQELMKSRRRMMPPINVRNKPIVNYTSFIISYI